MLKSIPILFIFILTSCWSGVSEIENQAQQLPENVQKKSEIQTKAEPELTLIMERFTWTHNLDYKIEIHPDGKINFTKNNGRFVNTKITGKFESKLEKEKLKQLLTEIEISDFFSLDSAYGYKYKNCQSAMSDNDSVKIYIKLNEKEHTIKHDLGCFDRSFAEVRRTANRKDNIFPQQLYKKDNIFPQQLYKLENKIDEIVEPKRWIGERK